jgi:hypothetical protein
MALAVLFAAACFAEDPGLGPNGTLPPRSGDPHFGDIATCVPPVGVPVGSCPGQDCPQNAIGENEPDGSSLQLARCALDVVFTRGTIYTPEFINGGDGGRPDLVIHLGPSASGSARIEASENGVTYTVIGFLNTPTALPGSVDPRCVARCVEQRCTPGALCSDGSTPCDQDGFCYATTCKAGGQAVVDLSAGFASGGSGGCNTIANVRHVRLTHVEGSPASLQVDALEALSRAFCPNNSQSCGAQP